MARKIAASFVAAVALVALVGLAPPSPAATPQITDPALDHPPPWADIVSVELHVIKQRGSDYIQTTFTMAGAIDDANRTLLTAYNFAGQVGNCELNLGWYAFPKVTEGLPPFAFPSGSAYGRCGAKGRDVGGSFKFTGKTVTVLTPVRDLKGVTKGSKMSKLAAWTAPLEGLAGDPPSLDEGTSEPKVLKLVGDAASSDKTYALS